MRSGQPSVDYGGAPYVHVPSGSLFNPFSLEMERTLVGPRMDLARAYARANGLTRVVLDGDRSWLGLVAAGTSYYDLREALHTLGLSERDLCRLGVRILKLGMIWPLDPDTIREFSRGLEEIVVIEDKGPLVETSVRDALYDLAERPRVLGNRDEHGEELLPASGLRRDRHYCSRGGLATVGQGRCRVDPGSPEAAELASSRGGTWHAVATGVLLLRVSAQPLDGCA